MTSCRSWHCTAACKASDSRLNGLWKMSFPFLHMSQALPWLLCRKEPKAVRLGFSRPPSRTAVPISRTLDGYLKRLRGCARRLSSRLWLFVCHGNRDISMASYQEFQRSLRDIMSKDRTYLAQKLCPSFHTLRTSHTKLERLPISQTRRTYLPVRLSRW